MHQRHNLYLMNNLSMLSLVLVDPENYKFFNHRLSDNVLRKWEFFNEIIVNCLTKKNLQNIKTNK